MEVPCLPQNRNLHGKMLSVKNHHFPWASIVRWSEVEKIKQCHLLLLSHFQLFYFTWYGMVFYYIYSLLYIFFIFHRVKYKAWNTEFYLEGLLHEIGLIYITNKLHHRKCFVQILFTRCKTLETHLLATLTLSFLKFCDS